MTIAKILCLTLPICKYITYVNNTNNQATIHENKSRITLPICDSHNFCPVKIRAHTKYGHTQSIREVCRRESKNLMIGMGVA